METAKEFLKRDESGVYNEIDIAQAMIEFAKMHVEAALKKADNHAKMYNETVNIKDSILNSYPLTNIK
jgi:hypothetical protein